MQFTLGSCDFKHGSEPGASPNRSVIDQITAYEQLI